MQVCPAGNDGQLSKPGDHGCQCRTPDTHLGRAEVTEDQHIIQEQIHQHRDDAGDHGHHGLPGLPEGAGIGIAQGEG